MNPAPLLVRCICWSALLSPLLAVPSLADDKPDSTVEIIQFKAPAGWQASDRPGQPVKIFTAPDSNATQQSMILVLVSPPQNELDLASAFEAAIKEVTSNGKVLESTDVVSSKTRQGFDAVSRTLVAQAAGDQRIYARMVAAKVNNRFAGIYYLATSQEMYDQHQAEMAALLQSVSFSADAGAVGGLAAAKSELEALEKQKKELLKKVAEIEARQRQLTASVPGAAAPAGAAAAGAAADSGEQLLAKARERFAKEVGARRKPHTILGDVLALDGKPIPNVVAYRVYVWGTTVAAEKTRYGLDVDQNGHFEQQVPDGLYQIRATCIVEHAGHRVPVDLVWLDDKKQGVDQASAGGIVRDFRMVVNGLKPGEDPKGANSYYGGTFGVNGPPYELTRGNFSTRHPGGKVRLTLTPQGALVDGSRAEPFTLDFDVRDLDYSAHPRSIPLGAYKVSAVLIEKDGGKRPLPCASGFSAEYGDSVDLFWESTRDYPEDRAEPMIYLKD
jgi:hypothetical protein